jgi:hypothetical protein
MSILRLVPFDAPAYSVVDDPALTKCLSDSARRIFSALGAPK